MKKLDISMVYLEPFIPQSVRIPAKVMKIIKDDAQLQGRKLGVHITTILVSYINAKVEHADKKD